MHIAIIGSGIAGLSAAWLLSRRHAVTLFEREPAPGGHSRTVDVEIDGAMVPVDTGFMVFNAATYPNLTALFRHLGIATRPSPMSFSVSVDGGVLEYAGSGLNSFFAQRRNILRAAHWRLLADILRFYREAAAPPRAGAPGEDASLGDWLLARRFSRGFIADHLLPMASAIWSIPPGLVLEHAAADFLRFFGNHGLLTLRGRPAWRCVAGGSAVYVRRMSAAISGRVHCGGAVAAIRRGVRRVEVRLASGEAQDFDQVVIAAHADQALALLDDPSEAERNLLGAIRYQRNLACLHDDTALMPARRSIWSSWNYRFDRARAEAPSVTYWINKLQGQSARRQLFVTLNPPADSIRPGGEIDRIAFDHPLSDRAASAARRELWRLQGQRGTWFCGAYFGDGFHEDGLQAGLAVAEALGGVRRPWRVENESGRIHLGPLAESLPVAEPMRALEPVA